MSYAARHSHKPRAGTASSNAPEAAVRAAPSHDPTPPGHRPIRLLRLPQVIDATGLGKTKIYELQGQGDFPMRVKITAHSVAWVEEDVQAWLAARIQANSTQSTA
jgi:prophage regulatory protein